MTDTGGRPSKLAWALPQLRCHYRRSALLGAHSHTASSRPCLSCLVCPLLPSEIIVSEEDMFSAIPDVIRDIGSYDITSVRGAYRR